MTADDAARWGRVAALLEAALARAPAERDAFLDAACAGDAGLRAEVASLVAAHERPGAADRLGADLAPLARRVRGSAASARPALQGQVVGRYEVQEPIGGGGMGVVHRAVDTRLGRTVALKFLQPRLDADDSAAERFRLEARAAAALEHPNICTVHEIGETAEGRLFLAMPLYDGETLERRIARGPLAVADAVGIAAQVARGLAKAHAQGIVHRDVKPSNVLVTADGVVKLLDFGIAKLADVTLTGGAGPLGTAAYMSPEQRAGAPVDHRTDLWSLGVVLHEMLTGRRPLDGAPDPAAAAGPPSVSSLRPDAPPALDRIVATALAREPERRYPSASAMERDLLALGVAAGGPGTPTPVPGPPRRRARVGRRVALAAGVAVTLLAGTAWLGARRWRAPEAPPAVVAAAPSTIAVLPFADRSPGAGQEYFSDGMTEELIATLARVEGLRVASRTSSFAYRDRGLDVRAVGAQLGVAAVLEGSVRRDGDRLRITAQLVSVADGWQLWSETYDRAADDAFAVQQEIASAIVQTLRGRLVGGLAVDAGARGGPDAAAYDLYLKGRHALYLKGRYAWYSRTEEGLRTAATHFAQAVAQAPDYARAHAGLADAYAVLGFYDFLPPREAFPRADSAARRAAQLDPTLGGPHATLGYVALYHGWDFARAEESFRRAIALEPNYSTAHQWYANLLTAAGRFDEAERAMRRAEEIDPLSLIAKAALAWVHYHAGDHRAAVAQARETLELDADYAVAHLWGGWALQALDSLDAAVAAHRRAVAVTDGAALYVAALARSLALAGERDEAERLLAGLERGGDGGRYVPSYELARAHLALGRRDAALARLERAFDERSHSMVYLRVDPQLAPLRTDPRFARLVERVFGR